MTRRLRKALKDQKKQNKQKDLQIAGSLGIPLSGQLRVEVPNRNSYVFVRLRDNQNEVVQAFNNRVSPAYNLPVLVERQDNRYTVVSVDSARYQNNWTSFAPFLPRHGNTHSADFESGGGGDITFVHPRQFIPGLIFPSGSSGAPNAFMYPYLLRNLDGTWKYVGNTGTQNITTYKPATSGTAWMVLVYLDSVSGNPYLLINSGTPFASNLTGTSQIWPYIPTLNDPNAIPLAAIRLVSGTSTIGWDNIYDVRQFIHVITSGSSSGGGTGSSLTIWDEGISRGTATILNFVGDNVVATVSGTVANIYVTGSSGGGGINTGTLDARYLKLDTSNDPLTDQLDIDATATPGNGAIFGLTEGDAYTSDFEQLNSTQNNASSPVQLLYRNVDAVHSNAYALYIAEETLNAGYFEGGAIRYSINSVDKFLVNPNSTGTVMLLDTRYTLNSGNRLISIQNNTAEKFAMFGDGSIQPADGANIILATGTGMKIGTATNQKLGFFNTTPVTQPGAYVVTGVTTDRSFNADSTTVDELADVLGTLINDLKSLGLIG